jgi:integrase
MENQMASILKRGEYSYQAVIRRRGFPSQTKTFDTKAEAQKWARMIERDMDRGAWRDSSAAERSTLGDVLRRYAAEVTPAKKGASIEATKINAILRDPICSHRMSALSGMELAGWRDRRLKKVKGSTANRDLAIISHAIEIARKEWGMNIENPCRVVRRAPGSAPRDRRMNGEEQRFLREALQSTKNRFIEPMTFFAIETAMRRGELLELKWEHVNLEKRTAFLPDTKNGEARTVPLSTAALEILRSVGPTIHGNVFPITMETFKQAYTRAVARARDQYVKECTHDGKRPDHPKFMVDLHFHDLRHEAASRLFEVGLNVMEVASITGHKTLQTLKRYTHLRAEELALKLR